MPSHQFLSDLYTSKHFLFLSSSFIQLSRWEIILKWIVRNQLKGRGLVSSWSGWEEVASLLEHSNETAGSIKCGEFHN